jgi:hypothetical protein
VSDFATDRGALVNARDALSAARAAHTEAMAVRRALATTLDALDRRHESSEPGANTERAGLQSALDAAEASLAEARSQLDEARRDSANALETFGAFTDPRTSVGFLPDTQALVFFPLRIETRFARDGSGDKLLVRIYPDDCSIDTFEELLSESELANAKKYWRNIWRAGRVEDEERGAWRDLVAAHGSGRAGYIVDTYRPLNPGDQPTKAQATDEVLVIGTEAPLTPVEATSISAYWVAFWRAGNDLGARQNARIALETAVGAARAAQLVAAYVPIDLADPVPDPLPVGFTARVAFVVFPPDPLTKPAPWSQAPRVEQFPERFVVLGYTGGESSPSIEAIGRLVQLPLFVGPDPGVDVDANPSAAIHPDGGDLYVPDELRWMVDFGEAVQAGMALSIPLTPEQASIGFDRLLVVGIQLSASEGDGAAALETLLDHHRRGRAGLGLVAQGTPTHNTTGAGTGYARADDPDESFDDRRREPLFTVTADPGEKRDGQWVAEALGIAPNALTSVHGSDGRDQMNARAMQRAMWPATLGYWMDKMMTPVFDDDTIEYTREYFTRYVRGRGAVPALRIGGQPYGVLPTTAFSRISWLDRRDAGVRLAGSRFLARLHELLAAVSASWTDMSKDAAHVGVAGDPHQILLDIVGLHPSSAEYYSREAESLTELFNTLNFWGLGPDFFTALAALRLDDAAAALLARLGYSGEQAPDMLSHFFFTDANRLTTIIDDRPLSEHAAIRAYTDTNKNYIEWLRDAATDSLDAVVAEAGFTDDKSPTALLYLYLRHTIMLGYYDTSYELHKSAGVLDSGALAALKPEPAFVHIDASAASESRFGLLYKNEVAITSDPAILVSDYITANISVLAEAEGLAEQIAALDVLAHAPTAELDRLFSEHVDVCSYRYDAWLLGLVELQLEHMRAREVGGEDGEDAEEVSPSKGRGAYLGTYAWVEDLRPAHVALEPVKLPPDLEAVYGPTPEIRHDPHNGGYVHAPSIPHARTAGVLRAGYLANASTANPQTLAVNLSSDRVRAALSMLEGIRNGQSLGALLGYQFERGLHDAHDLVEVDKFIFPLRKAFPLVADALSPTATQPGVPIEAIEARNVLDGRKLIDHVKATNSWSYPFGIATLPDATATEKAAIDAQTNQIMDVYDAVADLALAEGVHQAVQGNFERVAATLDAYSKGNFPPEPEVVHTPPSGIGLTHRVGIQLRPGLAVPGGSGPAARVEPAIDAWLASMLPKPANTGCVVRWRDPATGVDRHRTVTLADLDVRPIDVLDLVLPDSTQAMTLLDDLIVRHVYITSAVRPDATLAIEYTTAPTSGVSIFELAPLVRVLRTIVRRSRPLRASDVMLANDARRTQDATTVIDRSRIAGPLADLDTLRGDIAAKSAMLEPLVNDPVTHEPNRIQILADVDTHLDDTVGLLTRGARFRLPACGFGFLFDWRRNAFEMLLGQVALFVARLDTKLADFDDLIASYDSLPAPTPDAERIAALQAAQALVTTALDPPPATAALLRTNLDARRAAFVARRNQFDALHITNVASYSGLYAALAALLPVSDIDLTPFDLKPLGDLAVQIVQDVATNLAGHHDVIDERSKVALNQLIANDNATSSASAVEALEAAAHALLGDDFTIVPEFDLDADQGAEWANALIASTSGALTNYLVNTAGIEFPVDEWAAGVARVRPMVGVWERATGFVDAFAGPAAVPTLTPIQFPYVAGESWVATQLDPSDKVTSDRLCYTAAYSEPFDKTAKQCGLLLDEWTEVIPATQRDTGLAFNFDRPDNEPPQTILVITPATAHGSWVWDDIVGALNETLDLAKVRAVEPGRIDGTPYSMFVPATITAASTYAMTIGTYLSVANKGFEYMGGGII